MFNANILPQIQNMKMQITSIESQLDYLIIQIQNNASNLGNQIDNMSIQMFYLGIQFLNIGKQIPNNNQMDNMNKNMELKNVITQINNIVNPQINMPGMGITPINMFPMGPMGMPMMANQMQMNNELKEELDENKMKITFKTTQGVIHTLVYDFGTTIGFVLDLKKSSNLVLSPKLNLVAL